MRLSPAFHVDAGKEAHAIIMLAQRALHQWSWGHPPSPSVGPSCRATHLHPTSTPPFPALQRFILTAIHTEDKYSHVLGRFRLLTNISDRSPASVSSVFPFFVLSSAHATTRTASLSELDHCGSSILTGRDVRNVFLWKAIRN